MAGIALLSDLRSGAARARLPRLRACCARGGAVFHYEVEDEGDVPAALAMVARVRPRVLVLNGGDATLGAVMTAMRTSRPFGSSPPPLALLAGGPGDLVALELGAPGCPVAGLERAAVLAAGDVAGHMVRLTPIALSDEGGRVRLGMTLRGGPGGAPIALEPDGARPVSGRFALLMVTTLRRFSRGEPKLTVLALDRGWQAWLRAALGAVGGRLAGGYRARCERLSIRGGASLSLDGEPVGGRPLRLELADPVEFLRLAA